MGTNTITYLDRTFDAHDVISGNAYYARPLNSASLEIDTFSFDVQSDDTSLTEFIRNTPLTFYHDGNQMGIFLCSDNLAHLHQHLPLYLHLYRWSVG